MTPEEMAEIHGRAMVVPPPWNASAFRDFLSAPRVVCAIRGRGFALGRVTLDEAELLTIAVDPSARRMGLGRACLAGFEAEALRSGAMRVFLEVAETNRAARKLYSGAGYAQVGIRSGYYREADGTPVDAILMSKTLGPA